MKVNLLEQGIRKVKKEDLVGIKEVLDSSELFPSEFLEDMINDYFNNPDSEDIWFCKSENGRIVSFGYCAPEKFTEGTYNLYAIAVRKESQGKGIGKKMMNHIENLLSRTGNRILIVETSGGPQFELTREFYHKCNYTEEATIRDFWNEGEGKVIFWKKLNNIVQK